MLRKTVILQQVLPIIVGVAWLFVLIGVRMYHTQSLQFGFYIWNTFLAIVPLVISGWLAQQQRIHLKAIIAIVIWLLFLPNAPYLITDIVHYEERQNVPFWYDIVVTFSAALLGLAITLQSIYFTAILFRKHCSKRTTISLIYVVLILCTYGVYLGRFERFNSWDIVSNTYELITTVCYQWLLPWRYWRVWSFCIVFGSLLFWAYLLVHNTRSQAFAVRHLRK
jgi:uncharacterized membrane protein